MKMDRLLQDLPPDGELALNVSSFKTHCLAIMKALEARKLSRVTVTRRGKPLVELRPVEAPGRSLWGAHRGSVRVAEGVDLTEPALDEPLDAEAGRLHR